MTDYTNYTEEELKGLVQADKPEKREHNWLCSFCFMEHSMSANIGLPQNKKCDHCGRTTKCYEVIK